MSARNASFLFSLCAIAVAGAFVSCDRTEDQSYPRPEWRESMPGSVSFPLAEPVTLTVGLAQGMSAPEAGNTSLAWLSDRTNVELRFMAIPSSPADIEFGQMIRAGQLPDIIAEARVDLSEPILHRLFVDMLEFPSLLPNYSRLVRENEAVRAGALSRLTAAGQLLSMGTYDAGAPPFAGVLAYRQDLFEQHRLRAATWTELRATMQRLKELYPDSYPFGGSFATMLRLMPSWFGSGFDPQHIVYFNAAANEWRFGPAEDGFRTFVTFMAEAVAAGLVDPESVIARDEVLVRKFVSDVVFMAPHTGPTGPFFPFTAPDYGGLTEAGVWDRTGRWVSSLELPPAPDGLARWAGTQRFNPTGPGWLVHTQGDHVGVAVALLDYLFAEEAAPAIALGLPGEHWSYVDGEVRLTDSMLDTYRSRGIAPLRQAIHDTGTSVGLPLTGLVFDYFGAFGYPTARSFQYYLHHDLAVNRIDAEVMAEPGIRIPFDDPTFQSARIDAVVTLRTVIESQIANFVLGRRDLSEYDDFVAEALRVGGARLVELYNERAAPGREEALAPLMGPR